MRPRNRRSKRQRSSHNTPHHRSQKSRASKRLRRLGHEPLEDRRLLAAPQLASVEGPLDVNVEALAPLNVALNGTDADGDPITYSVVSVTTDNGTISNVGDYLNAAISPQTNRSLVLNIEQRSKDNPDQVLQTFDPLILQLFDDLVPKTTQHFVDIVNAGDFNGDPIHRIVPDFVIQNMGSVPNPTTFDDEFSPLLQHTSAGILSLAKPSQDDAGAASFFITAGDTQYLDYNHPVFGFLTSGEAARQAINALPVEANPNTGENSQPVDPVYIRDAEIIHDDQNGIVRLDGLQDVASGSNTFEVKIRAVDSHGDFDPNEDLTITVHVTPSIHSNRPYLDPVPDLHTTAETPVDLQLTATDVDGGNLWFGIAPSLPGITSTVADSSSGLITLTPDQGYAGALLVYVGTRQDPYDSSDMSAFDTQESALLVTPATPTLELLNNYALAEPHNNTPGNELTFRLSNLSPYSYSSDMGTTTNGTTTVKIFAQKIVSGSPSGDPFVIYQGDATDLSMDVTSDGLTQLDQSAEYEFTAQQTWNGTIPIQNRAGETAQLVGEKSDPTKPVQIDTNAPEFTVTPSTMHVLGDGEYVYNAEATTEGTGTVYDLLRHPDGMTIDSSTGQVNWTPTAVGTYSVSIVVRPEPFPTPPAVLHTNIQEFDIVVADRPVLDIGDQSVNEGEPLTLDLNSLVTDLDANDTHSFTITNFGGSDDAGLLGVTGQPASISDDGMFEWTPTEMHGGNDYTFEVQVTDSFGLVSTDTFTVTVNKTNQDPMFLGQRDRFVKAGGLPLDLSFTATDADVPMQTLTYSLTQPAGLNATINPNTGAFHWQSDASDSGNIYTFTIHVDDGNGGSDSLDFKAYVDTNIPPAFIPANPKDINEGEPFEMDLSALFGDFSPGDTKTITIINNSAPAGASILAGTNTLSWTPSEAQGSPDGTEYTIQVMDEDSQGATATGEFKIIVHEVNVPPTLDPISDLAVGVNDPVTFSATGQDSDIPTQTLTYSLNLDAPAGASIDPSTGVFTWTPDASFDGTETKFTVTVKDGQQGKASQSFTVYVNKNAVPVLDEVPDTTIPDIVPYSHDLTQYLHDLDSGDTHTFSLLGTNVPVGASIDPSTGLFQWTPSADQGTTPGTPYPFTVMVDDGRGGTATTSFAITVEDNANTNPTIDPIADMTVNRGDTFTFTATANDTDVPANTLTFGLSDQPNGMTIDSATGEISWATDVAEPVATYTITVMVDDGAGGSDSTTFDLTVNAPPTLDIPNTNVDELVELPLDLKSFLTDENLPGDTPSFEFVGDNHGATLSTDGMFSYTPDESKGGSDVTFTVSVTDQGGLTSQSEFTVTVNDTNSAPVLDPIPDLPASAENPVNVGEQIDFTVSASDSDIPTDTLIYSLTDNNSTGATIDPNTGRFTWTPDISQDDKSFEFTVTVDDQHGGTDSQTFNVTVGQNTAPAFVGLPSPTIDEGTLLDLNLNDYVVDPDQTDTHTFALTNNPPIAGLMLDESTGQLTWTPSESQGLPGGQVFVIGVSVSDGIAPPVLGEIEVTVNEVNVNPTIDPIADMVVGRDATFEFTATASDTDLPDNTLTFSLSGQPSGMTIDPSTGLISWTTAVDEPAVTHTITVSVDDGAGGTADTSFDLRVTAAPQLNIADQSTNVDTELPLDLTTYVTDPNVGDTITYAFVGDGHGATLSESGMFAFTPDVSLAGTNVSFTVEATDQDGLTSDSTFQVTVNVAPQLTIDNQNANEGQPLNFDLNTYVTDANLPSDMLTFDFVGDNHGATIGSDGTFSFTPDASLAGTDVSFTVQVTDQGLLTDESTFTVTVNGAPQLAIGPQSVDETTELPLDLTMFLTDDNLPTDGHSFEFVGDNHGATLSSAGIFSYTPDESLGGTVVSFTVRVTDAGGLSTEDTFDVTVNDTNTAPVLDPIDDVAVAAEQPIDFTVTASDSDVPADTLTYSLTDNNSTGATLDAMSGQFLWTPSQAQDGMAYDFTVTVDDGHGGTDSQDFTVYVGINAPPKFRDIPDMTVDEGSQVSFNLGDYVFDANSGDTHTFALTNDPTSGAVTLDMSTGMFTWTPSEADGVAGGNVFTFSATVNDGTADPVETSFNVIVNEVNTAPTIDPINDMFVARDDTFTFTPTANDTDIPQNTLTYSLSGQPDGMTINPTTGLISWTTATDEAVMTYSITVTVDDGAGGTADTSFDLTVNPAPTLDIPNQQVDELTTLSLDLNNFVTDDSTTDTHTFALVSADDASATLSSDGMFSYTPDEAAGPGVYSFTVMVTDQGGLTSQSTFDVMVNEVNTPPNVQSIADQLVNEGETLDVQVMATDADLPANTLVYSLDTAPTGMTVDENGAIQWDTTGAGPVDQMVSVRVSDGHEADDVVVSFNVTVNVAPQLEIANTSVDENVPLSYDLSTFLTDGNLPDHDTISYTLTDNAGTSATLSPTTGVFDWTPAETDGGSMFTFTVQAVDQGGLMAMSTFTVTVNDTNVNPTIDPIENQAFNAGDTFTYQVVANDSDIPVNTLTYGLTGNVPDGMTINPATGEITWQTSSDATPNTYPVQVTVDDGAQGMASQAFMVTVNAAPSLDVPDQTIDEQVPFSLDVSQYLTDPNAGNDHHTFEFVGTGIPATITSDGLLRWTPTESDGGASYSVTVRAVDQGGLVATSSFLINVNEVNVNPILDPIDNLTVNAGDMIDFTATATDSDIPANTLTYSLMDQPSGMAIDPSTGQVTWDTTGAAGGDYMVTVLVDDGNQGQDSQAFTVTVNVAPQLNVANTMVDEGTPLSYDLNNFLTDANLPNDSHTFALLNGPDGLAVSDAGLLTWTPSEAQGPGDYPVTVRVTDQMGLTADSSFTITANEVNTNPVLDPIADQLVNQGTMFTVDAHATDSDVPANTLTYSLSTSPTGMTIDPSSGLISWDTTSVAGGAYDVTVMVDDGNNGSDQTSFAVTVNVAPTLNIDNQTVNETENLSVDLNNFVTDANVGDTHTFVLTGAPVSGVSIDNNGVLSWTPTAAQGPATYTFAVQTTDQGGLTATNTFDVTVVEPNVAPVLMMPSADQLTVVQPNEVNIMLAATDANANDTLTYDLVSGPNGATVDPVTGKLWMSTQSDSALGANTYTVRVTDNGTPAMSDQITFTVNVLPQGSSTTSPGGSSGSSASDGSSQPQSLSAYQALGFLTAADRSKSSGDPSLDTVVTGNAVPTPAASIAGVTGGGGSDQGGTLPAGAPNFSEGPDTGVAFNYDTTDGDQESNDENNSENGEENQQASHQGDQQTEVRGQEPDSDSGKSDDSTRPPLGQSTDTDGLEKAAREGAASQESAVESYDELALEWAADSDWTSPIVTDGSDIDLWWATGEGRLAVPVNHTPEAIAANTAEDTAEEAETAATEVVSRHERLVAAASAAYFAGPLLVTDLAELNRRPGAWRQRLRRLFGK